MVVIKVYRGIEAGLQVVPLRDGFKIFNILLAYADVLHLTLDS